MKKPDMKSRLKIVSIIIYVCSTYLNCNSQNGIMIDLRDGKEYRTVRIGDQIWMAQNLAYVKKDSINAQATKEELKIQEFQITTCYDRYIGNCEKFGALYSWKTAQNVCPEDWHLPSKREYDILITSLGDEKNRYLKLINYWGETDLLAGRLYATLGKNIIWRDMGLNKVGLFWTSTKTEYYAYVFSVHKKKRRVEMNDSGRNSGLSVRCLKDK
jgi:uncharacterized protein (TIGR02145 family)